MNTASLCTGVGGLELAVADVWPEARLVWTAEADRHCRAVLARHWPTAHHHGKFDHDGIINGPAWEDLGPVDVLTAGFPCQDISCAGAGAGIHGRRSSTFFAVAAAVRVLRPRWLVIENVAALRRRGLDVVTHTLAGLGYVGSWCSVRASDIGAPHRRERVFIVAADPESQRRQRDGQPGEPPGPRPYVEPRRTARVPADARSERIEPQHQSAPRSGRQVIDAVVGSGADAADADSDGIRTGRPGRPGQRWPAPSDLPQRSPHERDARQSGSEVPPDARQCGLSQQPPVDRPEPESHQRHPQRPRMEDGPRTWGAYWPAVHRWEQLTGERAPDPLVNGRLNPDLPRWMMGFPAGWLDGIPKTAQLRAAGNAVCPPQGALGIRTCLAIGADR